MTTTNKLVYDREAVIVEQLKTLIYKIKIGCYPDFSAESIYTHSAEHSIPYDT